MRAHETISGYFFSDLDREKGETFSDDRSFELFGRFRQEQQHRPLE
jgi:hypothetical protein